MKQEESIDIKLPETTDPDTDDKVVIDVQIAFTSKSWLAYDDGSRTIKASPTAKTNTGLTRLKVVLDDGEAKVDYYVLIMVLAGNQPAVEASKNE